jgi:putative DNA primase/helicase
MKIIDIPESMVELLEFLVDNVEPWADAEDIEFDLEAVEPYSDALLPAPFSDYVADEARRMRCPPDFVAVALVSAVGSVIGTGCGVRPKQRDNWTEVPNLWGGVVGGPGTLKSPGTSAGTYPVGWLETDAADEHQEALAAFNRRKVERDFELKAVKAKKQPSEEDMQRAVNLTLAEEEEPTRRRYRTNDATVEVIGELARANPRGLLVIRDELMGLLANCEKQGHEGDRAFFIEGWNGKDKFLVDRIGRGHVEVPRLCLSVFGGIQPGKLQDYMQGTLAGYDNDGLIQRFQLLVYPDSQAWEYVDEQPNREVQERVVSIFRTLANTDFTAMGAVSDDVAGIPYFRFSLSAQKAFIEWLTKLQARISKQDNHVLAEHLSKYKKLIPALALIFHLIDIANGKKSSNKGISLDALKRAIKWDVYLESHAYRIYSMASDPIKNAVTALAAKINNGHLKDGFSERDVYKAGWSYLKEDEVVQAACRELEQAQWLRRMRTERGPGRPASPSYQINPALRQK